MYHLIQFIQGQDPAYLLTTDLGATRCLNSGTTGPGPASEKGGGENEKGVNVSRHFPFFKNIVSKL